MVSDTLKMEQQCRGGFAGIAGSVSAKNSRLDRYKKPRAGN
jgi:hypothetical protein